MTRKLRKALALSTDDGWLLLQAWIWLLLTDVGLRVLAVPRIQQILAARTALSRGGDPAISTRVARLVDVAARHHLYPVRCLPRALTLQHLLARQGLITDLRIGVRRRGNTLDAHAWLEHAGRAIGEPADVGRQFTPLLPLETAS